MISPEFIYTYNRWRIVEEMMEDLNGDAHPGSSDMENP